MPFETPAHIPGNRLRVPASTTPTGQRFRVVIVYKNLARAFSSHIGLGVTALNIQKVLRARGIACEVWGVNSVAGLRERLAAAPAGSITHIVIFSPWISGADIQDIAIMNSGIEFAVTCHSNVAFLAADSRAFHLIREYMDVETATANFHLAGNSAALSSWIANTYNEVCWALPNMYYIDATAIPARQPFSGDLVRIGCFGAQRLLKNILAAGAAALELASQMRIDLEFWVSSTRQEGEGSSGVARSLKEMFVGVKFAKLIENSWEPWPQFRQTVRHMDLLMQPSFTESFNVVTADGVAEGVASVVGHAIDWVPSDWQAEVDDVDDIARTGKRLLLDPHAPVDGLNALTKHNNVAFDDWLKYLNDTTSHM